MIEHLTSHWTPDGNYVLTYKGQTLEFPAHELVTLRSEDQAIRYIESRLKVFAKLIDKNASSMPKIVSRRTPDEQKAEIIAEIVEQAKKYYTFKEQPHRPTYRRPFR